MGAPIVHREIWDDLPALVSVQPLQDFPLVLDIAEHNADVLIPFRNQRDTILATGIILAGLTLVLFWSLAHQIQSRDEQNQRLLRAAEALRASEVRLHDFAAMASDWFWEQGPDLRLSWVSTTSTDMQAHDPRRIGQFHWDHEDANGEAEKWRVHEEDLLARRPFADFRYRRVAKDGTIRHFSISGRPLFDAAGNFHGYRGIGQHISHQIEVEQQRDRARERAEHAEVFLRDALDSLSESVVICDEKDALVLVNDVYRRRYPEAMGAFVRAGPSRHSCASRMSAGEFPEANRLRRGLVGGTHAETPKCRRWLRPPTSRRHLDVDHRAADAQRRYRNDLQIDVTELKQTELALRRSEERLDLAQAAAGIGTWEYNID